ncbi:tetratricopeptide repeat protein 31 isoform X1 [Scyliorhinus canicula]|uniref:tetratricopeptide repeat protein 31 isoform X1 n=1 Tax=Scyliorhinus canicula TaxID=7830 RepID=UPI0018F59C86|nr:tetratricopeptide repeat protein 31 isoform X1 [Scyliorhinus canicula]
MRGDMLSVRDLCRLLGFPGDNFEKMDESAMECGEAPQTNGERTQIKLSCVQDNGIKLDKHVPDQERAKKKAARRRAKKKRQKERKKLEKGKSNEVNRQENEDSYSTEEIEETVRIQNIPECTEGAKETSQPLGIFGNGNNISVAATMDEEPEWDVSSAFVANAASHIKPKSKAKPDKRSKENKENEDKGHGLTDLDPLILKGRQLAEQGIDLAKQGNYLKAVELFTEAVQFDPKDHRYFGNRSYCYDRLRKYSLALEDAETSIRLAADWPKGYFRKGRALLGIKRYAEAESALEMVLRLDKDCDDAVNELFKVRMLRLMNMGFTQQQSLMALQQHQTVEAALDSRIVLNFQESHLGTLEMPEEEDHLFLINFPIIEDQTELPCASLWIGNVTVHVKEKQLKDLFRIYGEIESIRVLHERFCAFVNFKCHMAAAKALEALQGKEIENTKLLIRYPDRHLTKRSSPLQKPPVPMGVSVQPEIVTAECGLKRRGPVDDDECYFWRTTGCHFGDKCRYKHIPDHRGVDKKPWQR